MLTRFCMLILRCMLPFCRPGQGAQGWTVPALGTLLSFCCPGHGCAGLDSEVALLARPRLSGMLILLCMLTEPCTLR